MDKFCGKTDFYNDKPASAWSKKHPIPASCALAGNTALHAGTDGKRQTLESDVEISLTPGSRLQPTDAVPEERASRLL
jgi:hypothetical protein